MPEAEASTSMGIVELNVCATRAARTRVVHARARSGCGRGAAHVVQRLDAGGAVGHEGSVERVPGVQVLELQEAAEKVR